MNRMVLGWKNQCHVMFDLRCYASKRLSRGRKLHSHCILRSTSLKDVKLGISTLTHKNVLLFLLVLNPGQPINAVFFEEMWHNKHNLASNTDPITGTSALAIIAPQKVREVTSQGRHLSHKSEQFGELGWSLKWVFPKDGDVFGGRLTNSLWNILNQYKLNTLQTEAMGVLGVPSYGNWKMPQQFQLRHSGSSALVHALARQHPMDAHLHQTRWCARNSVWYRFYAWMDGWMDGCILMYIDVYWCIFDVYWCILMYINVY